MLGVGHTSLFDDYLSPNAYRGTNITFISNTQRFAVSKKRKAYTDNYIKVDLSDLTDKSGRGSELEFAFDLDFSYKWLLHDSPRFSLLAGGDLFFKLGAVYNLRNGNNPAQAKADISLGASTQAIYRFRIKSFPMALRCNVAMPLLGSDFSPEYGQLYYEMVEYGELSDCFFFSWPANTNRIMTGLWLDVPVRSMQFRVGYTSEYYGYKVNNLTYRNMDHVFVLGVMRMIELKRFGR